MSTIAPGPQDDSHQTLAPWCPSQGSCQTVRSLLAPAGLHVYQALTGGTRLSANLLAGAGSAL